MNFVNVAAIIAILQTAKADIYNVEVNNAAGTTAGGDIKVSCEAAGDQCCSSSSWTAIENMGASNVGSADCESPVSEGTYVGCIENTTSLATTLCSIVCSNGCNFEIESPLRNLDETSTNSTADTETLATTAGVPSDATADGFSLIDGEFSMVESVNISPPCPRNMVYPNPAFTIQPSTGAYVSSFPANLFTLTVSGGELQFEWNAPVANGAKSGGVRIGLSPDQFKKLSLGYSSQAQILNGFTSVQRLEVGGASTLKATLTSNTSSDLAVQAGGASTVHVISNVIGSVESQGASTVKVQADSVKDSLQAQGASTLNIDGSFGGSGNVGGASTLRITGEMSGVLRNEGASTVEANTITGVIDNSAASTINAASCANVNNADITSSCNIRSPPTVNVDVSPDEAISTSTCSAGTSLRSSISFATAAVAGTTTLIAFLLI
mmetsp:Transcript_11636/g.17803  ORF Transcript_11636/g.17803 Transcript_11636/m.17803 type:complete len:438 (+) Transcript_11636:78-1391(+)|eukprot:CAMPEP_0201737326 /NCGR_PEP_ID=MMETSP0593-20130828/42088_1 /ASSEMBLY_ACC=CAM_ASM_000672 /TAXON_ID=267983 /ORGANISM="Skeletonema japonicum, Strain CCMP2506" /LENGTH=437 /DNA_ID=CAMNT_0048231287 /DNA_START=47 /DNA_END=1360 /DNA_ORIENTATION=+